MIPQAELKPIGDPAIPVTSLDTKKVHIASIDILRALNMILMIFVNDLWSLKDIPAWLGHVERGVDGIGLADVVFPAFLFIVGLSLPYAIDNRRKKGDTDWQLVKHVLVRSIALLVMGYFWSMASRLTPRLLACPVHCGIRSAACVLYCFGILILEP